MSTTNQLIALARKKMLEETTELVDAPTLLQYADWTQQDIGKRAFPNNSILSATIPVTNGVGTLPADFGTLYGDSQQNAYNIFPELSIGDFGRVTGGNAVAVEGGVLRVTPLSTTTLNIKYYPLYPALSTTQDPTIDSYFHELIVYGMLARAYEDLQDDELASFYDGKYEAKLKQKISVMSNYEEASTRGGAMFNEISIIRDSNGGYWGGPNGW